jgi:hypothetical protein
VSRIRGEACPKCDHRPWVEIGTDRNGRLTETRLDPCDCATRATAPRAKGQPERAGVCQDCPQPTLHPLSIRCPDCQQRHKRAQDRERKRAQFRFGHPDRERVLKERRERYRRNREREKAAFRARYRADPERERERKREERAWQKARQAKRQNAT